MTDPKKFAFGLIAINKNDHIKRLRTAGDKVADAITALAGTTEFLVFNVVWFVSWILINTGVFGEHLIFDPYPFGFLTMVVSLEAIILAVFVLITQNRQSRRSEIRAELDYVTDLQADSEIVTILSILERIADKHEVDVSDLLTDLTANQKKILREHTVTKHDLED